MSFDWWQLGWATAGFFAVMFLTLAIGTRNHFKKGQEAGEVKGWHDRQHWETDEMVSGKLRRE
jgi:hypothetical protein